MEFDAFSRMLFSSTPLLPNGTVSWFALHLGWAIVLGSVALLVSSWLLPRYRWTLALLALVWTLLPNASSPAFWLGLAFQSPSLMSVVLCVNWLLGYAALRQDTSTRHTVTDSWSQNVLLLLGVLLGWGLLLDTLAWFPVSIYAWGFGSMALALVLTMATLLWLLSGSRTAALLLAVLAVFVLTRAPTGNLWDALLDPLLWVALQLGYLLTVARRYWRARRLRAATHA